MVKNSPFCPPTAYPEKGDQDCEKNMVFQSFDLHSSQPSSLLPVGVHSKWSVQTSKQICAQCSSTSVGLPQVCHNYSIANNDFLHLHTARNFGVWLRVVVMKNSSFVHQQFILRKETPPPFRWIPSLLTCTAVNWFSHLTQLEFTVSGWSKQASKYAHTQVHKGNYESRNAERK